MLCKTCSVKVKEASRETLYRFMPIEALLTWIIDLNMIPASNMYAPKINGKRLTGVSFTRNKNLGSHKSDWLGSSVRVTVDGNKLNQRYKIVPYGDTGYAHRNVDYSEAEEFLIGSINNVDDYIARVDIDMDKALMELRGDHISLTTLLSDIHEFDEHFNIHYVGHDNTDKAEFKPKDKLYLYFDMSKNSKAWATFLKYTDPEYSPDIKDTLVGTSEAFHKPIGFEICMIVSKFRYNKSLTEGDYPAARGFVIKVLANKGSDWKNLKADYSDAKYMLDTYAGMNFEFGWI